MKVLVTGSNGFLGSNLINNYKTQYKVIGTSLNSTIFDNKIKFEAGDLTDENFIKNLIMNYKPDVVINTVANVNLDLCECQESNAYKINVQTAINISKSLTKNIHLIHISTDNLFDGKKSFYSENDNPRPLNVYGQTKLLAENECINRHSNTSIIRTNIFGWSPSNHKNTFAEWVYHNLNNNLSIKMFTDLYFTPIEVNLFAKALEQVLKSKIRGVFNIAGTERCSKYTFGVEMSKFFGFNQKNIIPSMIDSHSFIAQRQQDLSLSTEKFEKATGYTLPDLKISFSSLVNTFKNHMIK